MLSCANANNNNNNKKQEEEEGERERQTDRQTDRQSQRQTDRQTDRQTEGDRERRERVVGGGRKRRPHPIPNKTSAGSSQVVSLFVKTSNYVLKNVQIAASFFAF